MDIRCGLQIPVYGLGCGGAGANTVERELAETDAWVLARAIERAGYQPGRPFQV